jgi:hypothetical protein
MYGIERVPIEKSRQSGGIKNGGLPDTRASTVEFDLELKPRATGDLHVSDETESTIRFKRLHSPEIQRIAYSQCTRIWTAPA